ncbi:MAG: hypothetical protein JST59_30265 [Actinobacteria bacterium]|nr:hypothetical protein [Actinomycetota bacterium]
MTAGVPRRLDLLGPPAEGWWEYGRGASTVWVLAETAEEAGTNAEAQLRDLGAPLGLHPSFMAMCRAAGRGRR